MVQADLFTMRSDMLSNFSIFGGWHQRSYFEYRQSMQIGVRPRRERIYPDCVGMHFALPKLIAVAKEGRGCFTRHLFQDCRAGVHWNMHSSSCVMIPDAFDTTRFSRPRTRTLQVIFRPYTSIFEKSFLTHHIQYALHNITTRRCSCVLSSGSERYSLEIHTCSNQ